MNLHDIVRSAIESVHEDENCVLYQSLGQKNIKGEVKPIYAEPLQIRANIQPLGSQVLSHANACGDTKVSMEAFLYSDDSLPVAGQRRIPLTRNGDFIQRDDGTYWLITMVIEDWAKEGWAHVGIFRQIDLPDFSASEWSENNVLGGQ